MISAVLFDLDETLLDRTASLTAFLTDQYTRFGSQLGEVQLDYWRDRFLALDARGHVHKSLVYQTILSEFGGDELSADALLADYRERCCYHARGFPGMEETLKSLKKRGLQLGIVSNGETEFQNRHIDALNLRTYMDVVLISETEGLRKPDAALFLRALDRLGVSPERCLFVGDNPKADILGAHAVGMQTAWFSGGLAWPLDIAPLPSIAVYTLPALLALPGITR
ncbi:MAG: HAD family hydrolase [Parvibaculaceae bacterium]